MLAVADVVAAARVRCVPAGATAVVSLGDLDRLAEPDAFSASVERGGAFEAPVAVAAGRAYGVTGTAADGTSARPAYAVFGELDGERVLAAYDRATRRFTLALPAALLDPGPHELRFEVVAGDLRGYFVPAAPVELVARAAGGPAPPRRGRATTAPGTPSSS